MTADPILAKSAKCSIYDNRKKKHMQHMPCSSSNISCDKPIAFVIPCRRRLNLRVDGHRMKIEL